MGPLVPGRIAAARERATVHPNVEKCTVLTAKTHRADIDALLEPLRRGNAMRWAVVTEMRVLSVQQIANITVCLRCRRRIATSILRSSTTNHVDSGSSLAIRSDFELMSITIDSRTHSLVLLECFHGPFSILFSGY